MRSCVQRFAGTNRKFWFHLGLRSFLSLALLYCIYLAVRQGMGAWRFRQGSAQSIQSAIGWDPDNPQYYDALAAVMHFFSANSIPQDIVRLDENAARLSPRNAQYWADLGEARDWAGDKGEALRAFNRAQELFPNSPQINWRIANFDIRSRKINEGLQALQKVLLGSGIAPHDVFALATRATGNDEAILDLALPARAPIALDYVNFLSQGHDVDAAERAWDRLLHMNRPFDLRQTSPYLDALIRDRHLEDLQQAWSALDKRFPGKLSRRTPETNLITNGSFESEILDMGFDWRVLPIEEAVVSVDPLQSCDGQRSLRIEFDGTNNVDYWHVFQFVPVMPRSRYRFSGYMRLEGITTDSGPRFEIYDAYEMTKLFVSTKNMTGTSDWSLQQVEFETGADTRLLVVRVARPTSRKFDNKIAGTIWIDRVDVEPEN
jgi:tetratricopeptide (TPR) repeat protein